MYQRQIRIGGPLTPVVKKLLIINVAIFLITYLIHILNKIPVNQPTIIEYSLGLSYPFIIEKFYIWQFFTYIFLHGGWMHIIFNSLALWMFGGDLEEHWGSKFFLKYYLFSGIGAGIFIFIFNYFLKSPMPTIGASGAIYGLLMAYGITWPNRQVYVYGIIPMKIKYLVLIFGLIEFFSTLQTISGTGSIISNIGHLGGLISGFLILWFKANTVKKNKKSSIIEKKARKQKNKKHKALIDKRIKAQKIIDEMLEKIAENGIESLSDQEKKDLEWARKNYYPDNKDIIH